MWTCNKTSLRRPSLPFDSLPYPTRTICRNVRMYVQWNPVNTDTNATCHSVRVNRVSLLRGLVLEKIYGLLYRRDKRNRPLHPGVRIKRVSVERGSTVGTCVRTLGQSRDNQTKRGWPYSMSMMLCPTRASRAWEPRYKLSTGVTFFFRKFCRLKLYSSTSHVQTLT